MQATHVIQNVLIATFKKQKETGEINFKYIISPNISTVLLLNNQLIIIHEKFCICFLPKYLESGVCFAPAACVSPGWAHVLTPLPLPMSAP